MVRKSIPLARQVVQEILTGIESGTLARGNGMLPSEAELSLHFAVSRATIREALSQLEQRGVVSRRHGVGTFIVPPSPRIDAGLEKLESLETLASRMGLESHMGTPAIAERPATVSEAKCLHLTSVAPVLSVSRVIMTGEQPIAYLVDIVPTRVLQREHLDHAFRGSVLDLFIHNNVNLSHARTDISIESADETIARMLRLRPGEPLLKLEAQLYTRDGAVVDYSQSYFVPGYFHFHVIRRVGDPHDGSV